MTDTVKLANRFRKLPFASICEQIEPLALEIEASRFANAMEILRQEIAVHQDCDNWIKADVLSKALREIRTVRDRVLAALTRNPIGVETNKQGD
jgi:hypothetical protein